METCTWRYEIKILGNSDVVRKTSTGKEKMEAQVIFLNLLPFAHHENRFVVSPFLTKKAHRVGRGEEAGVGFWTPFAPPPPGSLVLSCSLLPPKMAGKFKLYSVSLLVFMALTSYSSCPHPPPLLIS